MDASDIIKRIEALEAKVAAIHEYINGEKLRNGYFSNGPDPLLPQAIQLLVGQDRASASLFQRRLRVGYARAARLLDELHDGGYVGAALGAQPRVVDKAKVVAYCFEKSQGINNA